jgi:hypothetical protein
MQGKIWEYQEELDHEKVKKDEKRNYEVSIMKESKELHHKNRIYRSQAEHHETMKESPKYLIQRDIQEQELSRKRSSDRKMLNSHNAKTIENSHK